MDTQKTNKFSVRDFLFVVFKRKIPIILFFCATVFAVTLGTFMTKPTYETSSQVLVKVGRENIYVPPSGDLKPIIQIDSEQQINSEIEILKGQSLAKEVVQSIGPTIIYKDLKVKGSRAPVAVTSDNAQKQLVMMATSRLQKALDFRRIVKSSVIEVIFKHHDPQMAATVVNDLVTFFLSRHVEIHKNPQTYQFFKEQSQAFKNKLTETENSLKLLKAQHDITSLNEQQSLFLGQEANLKDKLDSTITQEVEARSRIAQISQQMGAMPKTIQEREVNQYTYLINTLEARLMELELKEKGLLGKYTDQNRLIQNVKGEIRIVRKKLNEQKKLQRKILFGPNAVYQSLQAELFKNETDLRAFNAKRMIQSAQLADQRTNIRTLNQIETELSHLEYQLDINRQNYRLYLTKLEESRTSNVMDAEKITNVSVIQSAIPPMKPVSPKVRLNLALGIFLGAFGGLFLAFFLEYLDDSLDKPEDVEQYLDLPVLVSVPELKG